MYKSGDNIPRYTENQGKKRYLPRLLPVLFGHERKEYSHWPLGAQDDIHCDSSGCQDPGS